MSMLDDLLQIQEQIKVLRPKNHVDIILSTRCPTETDDGIRIEYKGKWYLILHWVTVRKVEMQCQREVLKPSLFGYTALLGIPVVENEELVREILLFIHSQPNNLELTDKAKEWAFK